MPRRGSLAVVDGREKHILERLNTGISLTNCRKLTKPLTEGLLGGRDIKVADGVDVIISGSY